MAREDELVEARVVPDRCLGAQALVQRVGIRAVLGRERIDVAQLEDLRLGRHRDPFHMHHTTRARTGPCDVDHSLVV